MVNIEINGDACKGCNLCISVCRFEVLEINRCNLNKKGYHPVTVAHKEKCTVCASCALICPDSAIRIIKY